MTFCLEAMKGAIVGASEGFFRIGWLEIERCLDFFSILDTSVFQSFVQRLDPQKTWDQSAYKPLFATATERGSTPNVLTIGFP